MTTPLPESQMGPAEHLLALILNGSAHLWWWHRKVSHSPWTHARRALSARLSAALLGGPERRERFWIRDADAAFASGFRSARKPPY